MKVIGFRLTALDESDAVCTKRSPLLDIIFDGSKETKCNGKPVTDYQNQEVVVDMKASSDVAPDCTVNAETTSTSSPSRSLDKVAVSGAGTEESEVGISVASMDGVAESEEKPDDTTLPVLEKDTNFEGKELRKTGRCTK